MWQLPEIDPAGRADYARRTAMCLAALGYTPHEVIGIIADQLAEDPPVVTNWLRRGSPASDAHAA